jgi:hypothetical protein
MSSTIPHVPTQSHLTRSAGRRPVLAVLAGLALMSGCAALNLVTSDVSSYGSWPAERAPGSFAFDRLPSQDARAKDQDALEQLALPALLAAGFVQTDTKASADVLVQVGARVDRQDRSPWDDPLWGYAWGPRWRATPWANPYWRDYALRHPDYTREVAVLIRDRSSGAALYETRANTAGITAGGRALLGAMFSAALKEFPSVQSEPHAVSAELP